MGEQALDRYRRGAFVGLLDIEPREVLRHRVVESEVAVVAQLHHAGAGEQLGNRTDAVDRSRRRGGHTVDVGVAVALAPDQVLIVYHAYGDPWNSLVGQLGIHPHVQETERRGHSGVVAERLRRRGKRGGEGEGDGCYDHSGHGALLGADRLGQEYRLGREEGQSVVT